MIFIDSNILLYLFGDDQKRKTYVLSLFGQNHHISTQVTGENINVCLRKFKLSKADAFAHSSNLIAHFRVEIIFTTTIEKAMDISTRYGFSYWDSLIVATAFEANCTEVYSEDMQDGVVIDKRLKIVNPFKKMGI
jgi:predicted nucleic acid-binding protein